MPRLLSTACIFGAICFGENWSGTLVDAGCVDRHEQSLDQCSPTRNTTAYAVKLPDGRLLRFDDTGNARAAELTRNRTGAIAVKITGLLEAPDSVRVDAIDIQ